MSGWELAGRSAAVFVVLLIGSRVIGKKLISQMTFFDFVAGVTIGAIGGGIMFADSATLAAGLGALVVFMGLTFLSGIASLKSFRMRKILEAEPTLLIDQGQIMEKNMEKARLTMNDLLMMLRNKDVFYVDEVETAYFEPDGKLSVRKKPEYLPVTRKDMQLNAASRGLSQAVIIDGRVLPDNLKAFGKDIRWIAETLRKQGIPDIKQVALAHIDTQGNLYVDKREDGQLLH